MNKKNITVVFKMDIDAVMGAGFRTYCPEVEVNSTDKHMQTTLDELPSDKQFRVISALIATCAAHITHAMATNGMGPKEELIGTFVSMYVKFTRGAASGEGSVTDLLNKN
jgi:hypothetical protein